jgi:hypothetical protein
MLWSFGEKHKYSTPDAFKSRASVVQVVGIASWVPFIKALKSQKLGWLNAVASSMYISIMSLFKICKEVGHELIYILAISKIKQASNLTFRRSAIF